MSKIYLQSDNGGYGLLITDERGAWWYWGEYGLPVDLNERDEDDRLNDKLNVEKIRRAIADGELYAADDFVSECDDEHRIKEYTGLMSIDAVSAYENNGRDFDLTEYTEI